MNNLSDKRISCREYNSSWGLVLLKNLRKLQTESPYSHGDGVCAHCSNYSDEAVKMSLKERWENELLTKAFLGGYTMKKVLVAGSEGFIGKNLVCYKATTFLGVKNEKRFSNLWQSCN
jgi:hypothetical protein